MEKILLFSITAMALLGSPPILTAQPHDDDREGHGRESEDHRCGYRKMPKLIGSLPDGRPVYGVQPFGGDIYVIRDSTPYIEVYDGRNFQKKANITVDNLQGPYDMVKSRHSPVALFIVDWFDASNMTVVRIPGGTVSVWSLQENGYTSFGLAGPNVFTGQNILVTASVSQKLRKFNPAGNLAEVITLRNISSPRQSIQVGTDRYAVCFGYGPPPALHQVCLVNGLGETIKCYGGTRGSGVGQLNIPARLERNEKNCILVADSGNKRVVLLDEHVEYVEDLISTGLNGPYRLYLDQEHDRLYVADNTVDGSGYAVSGRVLVYEVE